MPQPGIGHNVESATIEIEVRLFNSLVRHAPPGAADQRIAVAAGTTIGEVMRRMRLPRNEVYLVLRNGRDVSPGLFGAVNEEAALEDGDIVAFSGPVPYSWGYGAPVV